ncbi:hypothetical protein SeMB42_g02140 [Synchytrium endobioticum]|uniref:NADH dehydrogenase [ubiquinone] 1 beta subcomplex subunit 10 n=1 Tax=Synchytrium endobioticum TaxID=286115 RepID=A0A507DGH7_9FUNG|nr:hypothetical protein SeLEV6574_g06488 [Synchytrium endobioticum]TPX50713.1 hypothetical protein SeMB42_g02140 [Synchytrium endobioticum]
MTTFKVSDFPVVDPDLDVYDRAAVLKAKEDFFREQMVRTEEIIVLRDKMRWCYRREEVNHLQNCRHLAQQYLNLLRASKDGWVVPFHYPEQKGARDADEGSGQH